MMASIPVEEVISQPDRELSNQCIATLRETMHQQEGWIKVHAAEYLLWLGHPEDVKNVFLEEEKKHGDQPQYRIGIWRVLSQAVPPAERQNWAGKILKVFLDEHATDRVFAAESLAKLKMSPLDDYPVQTKEALNSGIKPLSLYTSWSVCFSVDSIADGPVHLMKLLENAEGALSKTMLAYAIRNMQGLTDLQWERLARMALAEPENSLSKVYLLSAAFVKGTHEKGYDPGLLLQVYNGLSLRKAIPMKTEKMEIAIAFSEKGSAKDLDFLKAVFKNEYATGRPDDDADLSSTAAYAILKILGRMPAGTTTH